MKIRRTLGTMARAVADRLAPVEQEVGGSDASRIEADAMGVLAKTISRLGGPTNPETCSDMLEAASEVLRLVEARLAAESRDARMLRSLSGWIRAERQLSLSGPRREIEERVRAALADEIDKMVAG